MKANIDEVVEYLLKTQKEILLKSTIALEKCKFEEFETLNVKYKTYDDVFDFIFKCGKHREDNDNE